MFTSGSSETLSKIQKLLDGQSDSKPPYIVCMSEYGEDDKSETEFKLKISESIFKPIYKLGVQGLLVKSGLTAANGDSELNDEL